MEGAKMRVGNQEQICAKIDYGVLSRLEEEQRVTGSSRNRLINRSVFVYTEMCDLIRKYRSGVINANQLAVILDTNLFFKGSARHL